ncbi:MAG TPA: DUF4438 domain-containing protein, partial [Planctomycetes bacterium]|nr:DUF4438 domain-containing protein [Planctomycetota bacterium]
MPLKTNLDELVQVAAGGEIAPPRKKRPYSVGADGEVASYPGVGGITYNVRVGMKAVGWASDHVEPGVSIR